MAVSLGSNATWYVAPLLFVGVTRTRWVPFQKLPKVRN
jgi:hypothetical protein